MKKQSVLSYFTDLFLVLLMTVGGLGCLQTGFDIRADSSFLLICLLWAIVSLLCWRIRWGWTVNLALLALYGLYFWKQEWAELTVQLIQCIGAYYYQAYGWDPWGLFSSAQSYLLYLDMGPCFALLGIVNIFVMGLVLSRRLPLSCCLPVALLPLVATLVVTDSAPHDFCAFLILLGLTLLTLTHTARRRDAAQGAKLTLMLLLPVALALAFFINSCPQSSYVRPYLPAFDTAVQIPGPGDHGTDATDDIRPTLPPVGVTGSRVDLDAIGPKSQSLRQVMTVKTSDSNLLYLRGRSYGDYMGIMWDTEEGTEDFSVGSDFTAQHQQTLIGQKVGTETVIIRTRSRMDILYTPYYVNQEISLTYGACLNASQESNYRFETVQLAHDWRTQLRDHYADLSIQQLQEDHPELAQYWQLTDSTRRQASELLEALEIWKTDHVHEAAAVIGSYVRNSARYDLNTAAMPESEMDFALWFLKQSDTGYCVHFASAAVVLLRAAGIPARYVEGYVIKPSELTSDGMREGIVREKDAHAWAEYYVPYVGWVILEATPADFYQPPEPQPTEPTLPLPTDPTEPTVPATTLPPATTAPTLPDTAPTVSDTAGPVTGGPKPEPIEIPDWVWQTVLAAAAAVLLLWLQWLLRLRLRFALLYTGKPNKRAVRCWHYGNYVNWLLGRKQPDALFRLAQKAAYSRDGVTEAEVSAVFGSFLDAAVAQMRKKNRFLRFVYRILLAIY